MTPDDLDDGDPFAAMNRRRSLAEAGVRVVAVALGDAGRSRAVAEGIAGLLAERGREAEVVVVEPHDGRASALARGLEDATLPLVLVTTADREWTAEHLDPLLAAIEKADHVVGSRRVNIIRRLARWVAALRWRILFAVPTNDVHSPLRLHRREKLTAIAFQSTSRFVDVETLAKGTFLGHLLDEVAVPALAVKASGAMGDDFRAVFRHPRVPSPRARSTGRTGGPGRRSRASRRRARAGRSRRPAR